MPQTQFRDDDTTPWAYKYGSGSDGSLTISSNTTDAPIDSACTGSAGTTSLTATNASFTANQIILIHQTQRTGAGTWELAKISSYTAGTITLKSNLMNNYVTGAQVLVVKQYVNTTINTGCTLTAKAWNGTVGGICAILASGTISVVGTILSTACGFRGGVGQANSWSNQGESTLGVGTIVTTANGMGGGGLPAPGSGVGPGGGGGHVASGGTGTGGSAQGAGGTTGGTSDLKTMVFGGAGGGSDSSSSGATGTNSSGIIVLIAPIISITGGMTGNGVAGSSNVNGQASSGSGAAGAILIKGQSITLGTSLITSSGKTPGTSSVSWIGGAGSDGRIHIDYAGAAPSGTTTPLATTSLQQSLASFGGGALAAFL